VHNLTLVIAPTGCPKYFVTGLDSLSASPMEMYTSHPANAPPQISTDFLLNRIRGGKQPITVRPESFHDDDPQNPRR
jgi:hypothetical protein